MTWSIWALLILLQLSLPLSESCSCIRSHPQQQFCRDDFVILARIRREYVVDDRRIYVVGVRKTFKMTEKAGVSLKTRRIITPAESSMCGTDLEVGKTYALSGKIFNFKAWINYCSNINILWKDLTNRQRKGLRKFYKEGCNCKINHCKAGKCAKYRTVCNLVSGSAQDCFIKQGICRKSSSNQCMWTRNKDLATCKKSFYTTYSPFRGDLGRRTAQ